MVGCNNFTQSCRRILISEIRASKPQTRHHKGTSGVVVLGNSFSKDKPTHNAHSQLSMTNYRTGCLATSQRSTAFLERNCPQHLFAVSAILAGLQERHAPLYGAEGLTLT